MNDDRRKRIAALVEKLDGLRTEATEFANEIEQIRDEEQEYFDNMPESFQQGDKGNRAEEVISLLDDSYNELDNIQSAIGDAMQALEGGAE